MWIYEIAWYETVEGVAFPIYRWKGFKTREKYEKFSARLEKKGCRIVGRIEEWKKVL